MRRGWTSVPVLAMAALALVCAVVATVLLVTSGAGASSDPNRAVVDRVRTAQVVGEVDTDLEHVLSFDYSNPEATRSAAHQALIGKALQQYDVLFETLQKKAGDQHLVLTAKVISAGVTLLNDGRAQLLVFLDQTSRRTSDGATSTSAAQLRITAVQRGGSWLISELDPL